MKDKTCCFTGHRKINPEDLDKLKENVTKEIEKLYKEGITDFICGGAVGFDTLAACMVIRFKKDNPDAKLILAIPCHEQDKNFSLQEKKDYSLIMELSDEIIYTSDKYTKGCMHKRNRFMVDNSSYIITYVRKKEGGSFYTRNYALNQNIKVIDI